MKKCPFCAEQIQSDAIKCRYCGSLLNGAEAFLPDAELQQFIQSGKKIDAIKLVRSRTALGLKEAKEYVEALERGESPPPPRLVRRNGESRPGCAQVILAIVAGAFITCVVLSWL